MDQHPSIQGLFFIDNFITKEEEQTLLQILNNNAWEEVVNRRSQQFGKYYNQQKKTIDKQKFIPFPHYLDFIQSRIKQKNIFEDNFEETSWLIQQYTPGQGIHPHIDQYGNKVIGINLGADAQMIFAHGNEEIIVPLKRRGLYLMTGEARYQWKHGIKDVGKRRVSITVRNIIFNQNLIKK